MEKKFTINNPEQINSKSFTPPPVPNIAAKPTVIIGKQALAAEKKIFLKVTPEQEDQPIGNSAIFNRPIYSDITFFSGSYVDQNGRTIEYGPLNIQDVLITVMNQKNIIETTLQGRNGTVKEYISDGDFQIKIEGRIYGGGMNNYPQEAVQKLIGICEAPQALNVVSSFLKMFDVDNIVVKSYNIDQLEGIRNYQPFTLNCVSDYPLILLKNA